MAGVTSNAAAAELESLPAELSTPAPSTRSKVLMGNGKTLAYFYDENRIPVKLEGHRPDHADGAAGRSRITATTNTARWTSRARCEHWSATPRPSGDTQGGSSVTQQYVKMVQIEACQAKGDAQCVREAQAPTMERKIRELRYAIALEKKLTKDQILERYLNIAYYGEGAYGVEAAARHYYSTKASKLTLRTGGDAGRPGAEPGYQQPGAQPQRSTRPSRRRIQPDGRAQVDHARPGARRRKQVGFDQDKVKKTRNGCVGTRYPFLCDYVRRTLLNDAQPGEDRRRPREHDQPRRADHPDCASTPRPKTWRRRRSVSVVGPEDPVISTMNMIQPGTGLIIAMAQSRPVMGSNAKKGQTYWNLAVGSGYGRHPGLSGGFDLQGVHACGSLGEGHPDQQEVPRQVAVQLHGRRYYVLPWARAHLGALGRQELSRAQQDHRDDGGGTVVGQHLLHPAGAGRPACAVSPRWPSGPACKVGARIGQPPLDIVKRVPEQAVVHPRHASR